MCFLDCCDDVVFFFGFGCCFVYGGCVGLGWLFVVVVYWFL